MSPVSRLPARLAGGLALLLAHVAPAQTAPAPIDLPTALRLAGAANLEVKLAQEKVAEARAASDLARNRFLPWITPSLAIRRHEENVQAVNGPVFAADKQSLAAGLAVQAQLEPGEIYFQHLVSRQQVRAAEAAAASRQRETVLRAAAGYFELLRARAAVAAAEESAAILERHAPGRRPRRDGPRLPRGRRPPCRGPRPRRPHRRPPAGRPADRRRPPRGDAAPRPRCGPRPG